MKGQLLFIPLLIFCFNGNAQSWEELNDSLNFFLSQKDYARSIATGEKALSAAQLEFGQDHGNYGLALKNLSIAYRRNENYPEALTKATGALQVYKKNKGEKSVEYATMLNQLGMIYARLKDTTRTAEAFNQAITVLHLIGKASDILESALYNLSNFYIVNKLFKSALPHLEEMVLLQAEIYGKESSDYAEGLDMLAKAYRETGKIMEAILVRKTIAEISKKKDGVASVVYGQELNRIAMLYESMNDTTQTEIYYRQAVIILRGQSPKPVNLVTVLNNFADFYETRGRYADALLLYEENDGLIKSLKRAGTISDITNAYNLARLYFHTNQFSLAETMCQQVIENLQKAIEQKHPNYAISLTNIADLYSKMKNYSRAESLYKEVLSIRKNTVGENHPDFASALNKLAGLYRTMGNYEKAEEHYLAALQIQKATKGVNDEIYVSTLSNLARVYMDADNYKKEEPVLLQLAEIALKKSGISSIYYANKLIDLGNLYYNAQRYKESEKNYLQAADIKREISGDTTNEYASVARSLGILYKKMRLFEKAEKWYNIQLSIRKKLYGEKNEIYLSELNSLADLYKSSKEMGKADSLYNLLIKEYQSLYGPGSQQNSQALVQLAMFYDSWEKYSLAEPLYLQAIEIDSRLYGVNNDSSFSNLLLLAGSYMEASQYDRSDSLNNLLLEIKVKKYGNQHFETARELDRHALWQESMGMYTQAVQNNIRAAAIFEKSLGAGSMYHINSLLQLGKLYAFIDNYNLGELTYLKAAGIVKNIYGEDHHEYAKILERLSDVYLRIGQYEKSETMLLRALELKKKYLSPAHLEISGTWSALAAIYMSMKKYTAAKECLTAAMKIIEETVGIETDNYARVLQTMGRVYISQKKYKEAQSYLFKAVNISEKSSARAWYAYSLSDLAEVYQNLSDFSNAEKYYEKSASVWEATYGKNHVAYGISCHTLADFYKERGLTNEAEQYFKKSIAVYENTLGIENSSVSNVLKKLAFFYHDIQLNDKAVPLLLRTKNIEIKNMMNLFVNLSEEEKSNYINEKMGLNNDFNSFLFYYPPASKDFIKGNNDLQLLFKSMVLNGTRSMISSIRESRDTALIKIFEKWQSNKSFLAKQYSLPLKQRKTDLSSIEAQTEYLEKELSIKSSGFRNQQKSSQTMSADVVKNLEKDESAIEFVRFKLIRNNRSDSIMYAAYILTRNDSIPVFVPLCEERQLQQLFDSAGTTATSMVSRFYRGAEVRNKNAAVTLGNALYKLVWQPLEPYLKGIKTVSYSPAGKLYSIAFHALPVDSNTVLMDKYVLQQYTSTRQVVLRDQGIANSQLKSITLFGDAAFSLDSAGIVKSKARKEERNIVGTSRYTLPGRGSRGGTWTNLPGTAEEVKKIRSVFEEKKINARAFTQTNATEENLKALSGNSPQVLHIATHGFFLSEPDIMGKESGLTNKNTYSVAEDPLLRSGLVFSGGNYAWSGKAPIEGIEDGIATAYEISQLNLSNTELVVLSACETALGDVKGSEGVFGLQRAFKMAGVKKMIVSLWQVPDKETAELMTAFYSYWLKGKTINEAFAQAQAEMRKKYSPYYWAAFVLVE